MILRSRYIQAPFHTYSWSSLLMPVTGAPQDIDMYCPNRPVKNGVRQNAVEMMTWAALYTISVRRSSIGFRCSIHRGPIQRTNSR
uniref:Uncharacterized protein n=1 Tax=Anopheles quadriannulatus TaxID=34691 RepID=A0A182XRX4_ANOQN